MLSLAPGLALGFCWVLAGSSGFQGRYEGVESSPCPGTQSYQFPVGPLVMVLHCALSSCFGKSGAAFWSYGSLGMVFIRTSRQGVPRLSASGGWVVDDVLWWQLGERVETGRAGGNGIVLRLLPPFQVGSEILQHYERAGSGLEQERVVGKCLG